MYSKSAKLRGKISYLKQLRRSAFQKKNANKAYELTKEIQNLTNELRKSYGDKNKKGV